MGNDILLGEKVKKIAKQKGITLCALEKDTGVSRGSISKWNEISPSFDKVCRVSKRLEVKLDDLIKEE